MSVLFPSVNKPREWDYRPIYYDPKKDERQQKLRKLQAQREKEKMQQEAAEEARMTETKAGNVATDYVPTLHRGSFREAKESGGSRYVNDARKRSRLAFWIALLVMLLFFVYCLI